MSGHLVPMVVEKVPGGERAFDIYSRLLKDRIIFLDGEIDTDKANLVIAQLLYLDAEDDSQDVRIYINSGGGCVKGGLAIIDTMNLIRADVRTVCVGEASSMAAVILGCGAKGKREALPNSTVLLHQPWGGVQGQASDIEIQAKEINRLKKKLYQLISEATGQTSAKVARDCDRDFILDADQAKEYGIIDDVIGVK